MKSPTQPPLVWTRRPLHFIHGDGAAIWDRINRAGTDLPFLQSRFICPLLQHSQIDNGLLVSATANGTPVAAAVLVAAGSGRMATAQPSQLPLGAWVVSREIDAGYAATSLAKALPLPAVAVGFTQQDEHFWPRPADRSLLESIDYIQTGWVDVAGGFDAFWESRGKNLRTNLRKQRTKLASESTVVSFERLTEPSQVDEAMAQYARLESAGWKAEQGTAVQHESVQARFYTEMMKAFCATGDGEIWQLRFNEKVVAVDLCIRTGSTLVILKTAYDPEYRTVSPSSLLKQDAFKAVFDDGSIQRIEFYGRLMEWHKRWTDNSRTLFHVNAYRWGWLQQLIQRRRARTDASPSRDEEPAAAPHES